MQVCKSAATVLLERAGAVAVSVGLAAQSTQRPRTQCMGSCSHGPEHRAGLGAGSVGQVAGRTAVMEEGASHWRRYRFVGKTVVRMVVELGVLEVRFDATGCMYILWREVEVGAVEVLVPKPVAEHSRIHHQP
jgi:hypothetical protein